MAFKISYKASVAHDLRKLDKANTARILHKLGQELAMRPHRGEALTGEFRGLFKYRVGDYRVVYVKVSDGVLVLRISHRCEVYPEVHLEKLPSLSWLPLL